MKRQAKHKSGMTLIELLAVVAIIGILAALMFPVFQGVRLRAQIRKARAESRELAKAWEAYWMHYGNAALPPLDIKMNAKNVQVLLGEDPLNKDKIKFMDFQAEARDGGFKDPWGKEYIVKVLQSNKNGGEVTNLEYKTRVYFPNKKAYLY